MDENTKPTLTPADGPSLAERIAAAIDDREIARDVRLTLSVGGGVAEQSYRYQFEASGGRGIRCELECELSGRSGRSEASEVDHEVFAELLREVRASGVLTTPAEGASFLPDTVVGVLDITDGVNELRHYFAADPDQAEIQGRTPPRSLRRTIEAIYAAGAKAMGLRSVAP